MKSNFLLIKAEIVRCLLILKRYPLEPLTDMFIISLSFISIYFGINLSLGGGDKDLTTLFLSYCLGIMSMLIISEMGMSIAREAQLGTLERIYTMPSRLFKVITVRNFVSLLFNTFKLSLFVGLFITLLKIRISLTVSFFFILFSFFLSLLGIGYILSGLTLRFKRIGELASILQFAYLFIVLIPYDSLPVVFRYILGYIPGAMAVQLIRNYEAVYILSFEYIISLIFGLSHLLIGIFLFKYFEKITLKKGMLTSY
ncbi:MAG: ABC transporter permease [Halanaerobiales bacterium]|nr:ABC transporter permease [Halanaerobiales bacterium]